MSAGLASGTANLSLADAVAPRSPALWRQALGLNRTRIGLAIVILVGAVAWLGPYAAPYGATEFVDAAYAPPSAAALFGADNLGRDVLSRFLSGGRSVLTLSLIATLLGVAGGTAIGLVAAYARGRWPDELLMRAMDILLAFPQIVFVLLLVASFGPRLWLIIATVAMTHVPRVARVARGAALEVVERDFVKSAEALGETRRHILFAEILPNMSSPLLVELGLRLTYSIGLIAAVSFLGFGLQPPAADWGLMINENRLGLTIQPWAVALPVLAIGLLTVGVNLVADGIARAAIGLDRRREG